MKFENPELQRRLAAEYALGTLRGPARRRFERLLACNANVRAEVYFWEMRLSEFGRVVGAVRPPDAAWTELEHRLGLPGIEQPRPPQRVRPTPYLRRVWRAAAGFAAAASLAGAFVLGQHNSHRPTIAVTMTAPAVSADAARAEGIEPASMTKSQIAQAAANELAVPIYVTQLQMPSTGMRWLVSVSPDHQQLLVIANGDYPKSDRERFNVELWCMSPGADPVPLGNLPKLHDQTAAFSIPRNLGKQQEVVFAISLESPNAANPGKPSGPIVDSAKDIGAI